MRSRATLSKRADRGSPTTARDLHRARTTRARVIEESPELMKEIEEKVRAAGITEDMIEDAFAEEDEDELDIRTLDLEG